METKRFAVAFSALIAAWVLLTPSKAEARVVGEWHTYTEVWKQATYPYNVRTYTYSMAWYYSLGNYSQRSYYNQRNIRLTFNAYGFRLMSSTLVKKAYMYGNW